MARRVTVRVRRHQSILFFIHRTFVITVGIFVNKLIANAMHIECVNVINYIFMFSDKFNRISPYNETGVVESVEGTRHS